MKLKVFSVYDVKAQAYLPPFFLPRTEMAVRVFSDSANDPTHMFCKHPEDFHLFELGEWDGETSQFDLLSSPKSQGLALFYKKVQELNLDQPEMLKEQAS